MLEYFFRRAFAYSLDILLIALIVDLVVTSKVNFQYKKYNDTYNEYYSEYELYKQHQEIDKIDSCDKLVEYINSEKLFNKNYVDKYKKIKDLKKSNDTLLEYDEKCNLIVEEYNSYNVTEKDFNNKTIMYSRILEKNSIIYYSLMIILSLLYFVLFQGFTGGQTLGKKFMRVKIVSKVENKDVTYKQLFFRTLFLNSIVCSIFILLGAYILDDFAYSILASVVTFLDTALMFVLAIMVFVNKERKGLHDVLLGTKVVVLDFKGNIIYDGLDHVEEEKLEEDLDENSVKIDEEKQEKKTKVKKVKTYKKKKK